MTDDRQTEASDWLLTHQVGASDADVHHVSDALPAEAFPFATADSL